MDKDALNRCEVDVKKFLTSQNKEALKNDETFSEKEKDMSYNEDAKNENINTCYHTYSKLQDYVYNFENDEFYNIQLSRNRHKSEVDMHSFEMEKSELKKKELVKTFEKDNDNTSSLYFTEVIKSIDTTGKEKNQIHNKLFRTKALN